MINHATLEVWGHLVHREVEFFKMLGFDIDLQPLRSAKYKAVWIKGEHDGTQSFIHLFPIGPRSRYPDRKPIIPRFGHIAIVLPAVAETRSRLSAAHFKTEDGTPYWGAERFMVTGPSGHRIEVMEFGPPQPKEEE